MSAFATTLNNACMHLSEGSEENKEIFKIYVLDREFNSGRLEYEAGVNFARLLLHSSLHVFLFFFFGGTTAL